MSDHGHGRSECEVCHRVMQTCRCMEAGKTVEYVVCPDCESKRAHARTQEFQKANERLRKNGIIP